MSRPSFLRRTVSMALLLAVCGASTAAAERYLTASAYGPYPLTGTFAPEIGILFDGGHTSFGLQVTSVEGNGDSSLIYNRTVGMVWEQGSTKVRAGGTLGIHDRVDTELVLAPLVQVASSVSARLEVFGEVAPFALRTGDRTVVQIFGAALGITFRP